MKKQDLLPKQSSEFSSQEIQNISEDLTKKTFWIQEEDAVPFIQIDGEDFFNAEEIQERFGLSRTVFFNQLCKKKTHFLDSQERSHEATGLSSSLEKFLSCMRAAVADEKNISFPEKEKGYVLQRPYGR